MGRTSIPDSTVKEVMGGSIIFTSDCSTCGYNCNNQFKVNNFDACIKFIDENKATMDERIMLKTMMELGYITRL